MKTILFGGVLALTAYAQTPTDQSAPSTGLNSNATQPAANVTAAELNLDWTTLDTLLADYCNSANVSTVDA